MVMVMVMVMTITTMTMTSVAYADATRAKWLRMMIVMKMIVDMNVDFANDVEYRN